MKIGMGKVKYAVAILVVCLASSLTAALTFDTDNVEFHGTKCQKLSIVDINVDDENRLHISFEKIPPVDSVLQGHTCILYVPFSAEPGRRNGAALLTGSYETVSHESVAMTLNISGVAMSGKPALNLIKGSPSGNFTWSYPFVFETEADYVKLKIDLSARILPGKASKSSEPDMQDEKRSLHLTFNNLVLTLQ